MENENKLILFCSADDGHDYVVIDTLGLTETQATEKYGLAYIGSRELESGTLGVWPTDTLLIMAAISQTFKEGGQE